VVVVGVLVGRLVLEVEADRQVEVELAHTHALRSSVSH
jgi:hypothetical protein